MAEVASLTQVFEAYAQDRFSELGEAYPDLEITFHFFSYQGLYECQGDEGCGALHSEHLFVMNTFFRMPVDHLGDITSLSMSHQSEVPYHDIADCDIHLLDQMVQECWSNWLSYLSLSEVEEALDGVVQRSDTPEA